MRMSVVWAFRDDVTEQRVLTHMWTYASGVLKRTLSAKTHAARIAQTNIRQFVSGFRASCSFHGLSSQLLMWQIDTTPITACLLLKFMALNQQ
jgi:hypothetical protein